MKEKEIIEQFYKMFDTVVNKEGRKINLLKENKISHKSIVQAVVRFVKELGIDVEPTPQTLNEYLNKPKHNFTIKGEK